MFEFSGIEACKDYTVEIEKYMDMLAPYIGVIFVIIGILMAFAGNKLLFQSFALMIFLLVTSCLFMIIYNFFLPHD